MSTQLVEKKVLAKSGFWLDSQKRLYTTTGRDDGFYLVCGATTQLLEHAVLWAPVDEAWNFVRYKEIPRDYRGPIFIGENGEYLRDAVKVLGLRSAKRPEGWDI